jgi:hypothetical protein
MLDTELNGNNYLLPTDIDIPRTEADIQFAGLKVDDLVNSIKSNTKIVFLDACRDNPALFKNIVKGRGSSPVGLAPAVSSNFEQAKAGGGVFIAYATDAGSVADDGRRTHSPFAQALLRYMQKPISIDDMFSLVTREVRLVTKNAQRPYKYASLENVVCLTPACLNAPISVPGNIIDQAKQSEDGELQIALQSKNADALETYLEKYPETGKRDDVRSEIESLRRSEFKEWTLFHIAEKHHPLFIQLSSIRRLGDRAVALIKWLPDPSKPMVFVGQSLPDAAFAEDLNVYDCTKPLTRISEQTIFNEAGEPIFHYKWADPEYLNLAVGQTLSAGSVGAGARYMTCGNHISFPLLNKRQLIDMKFNSLSSTANGDGDIFYEIPQHSVDVPNQKDVIVIIRSHSDHNVNDVFSPDVSIPDPPNYRIEVDHTLFRCDDNKFGFDIVESWNASNELVRVQVVEPSNVTFSEFQETSPFALLQGIVCGKSYAGLGINLTADGTSTKVARIFDGSPAERVGIKVNDIITHIDNESVTGLTLEQIIKKLRGLPKTRVRTH